METEAINNQVAIINKSIEIFRTAPDILKANQQRTQKAVIVGNSIIDQWIAAWNIQNDEERLEALRLADDRSNTYLVNCGAALKEEKEMRAAITQMMDEFKKMFTAAENEIDKTKAGSVADRVQGNRDKYVKEMAQVQERKRREAERKAAMAKEEIDLRAMADKWLMDRVINLLSEKKRSLTNAFNSITLDDYEKRSVALQGMRTTIAEDALRESVGTMSSLPKAIYHDANEVEAIANAVTNQFNWASHVENWGKEIDAIKTDLIEKLPGKHTELLEQKRIADEAAAEKERQRLAEEERQRQLAAAKAEEKKKLEEQQRIEREQEEQRLAQLKREQEEQDRQRKLREEEETERLRKEEEQKQKDAEQQREIEKQGAHTMTLFEKEATIAEAAPVPEARQGYEIEIFHPAAFVQIFQLWFENEGKNLPVDKIGNTKMDQMKAWAEKHAHKNDVKIESKFLTYHPSYKAVNRKQTPK